MKCARLNLQQRSRSRSRPPPPPERPRRICQQRLVDPSHSEDPRWTGMLMKRFSEDASEPDSFYNNRDEVEDLYLSVQTLKFQGEEPHHKRPKTCFKFRSNNAGNQHRMFVKQAVENEEQIEEDVQSQQTDDYFDDYVKYILNADRSSTASVNSSYCMFSQSQPKTNKAVQVNASNRKTIENTNNEDETNESDLSKDTRVSYQKVDNRQTLTISRAQSPETVQVIRVDVAFANCRSNSSLSQREENKTPEDEKPNKIDVENCVVSKQLAKKYLLTKSYNTLEQTVPGAKVTLMCKTFRLADRRLSSGVKDYTFGRNQIWKLDKT